MWAVLICLIIIHQALLGSRVKINMKKSQHQHLKPGAAGVKIKRTLWEKSGCGCHPKLQLTVLKEKRKKKEVSHNYQRIFPRILQATQFGEWLEADKSSTVQICPFAKRFVGYFPALCALVNRKVTHFGRSLLCWLLVPSPVLKSITSFQEQVPVRMQTRKFPQR